MAIYRAGSKGRLYKGAAKVKKAYQGAVKVYSSGNICTYHVETGISYMEEVDEGQSCLHPASFAPEKEGWEFAGWRQDAAAEGEVLGSLEMGDDPVELYAVFRQEVVLATVANGTTERETKPRLYNNGNLASPVFTVASPSKAGATFRGWSSGAGSTAITNAAITNLELDTSTTRWAVFTYNTKIVSGWAATGSATTADRTTTFTLDQNTHIISGCIWTASVGCNNRGDGGVTVWINGRIVFDDNRTGNFTGSGTCTLNNGSNAVRCVVTCWTGDLNVSITVQGRTVVG